MEATDDQELLGPLPHFEALEELLLPGLQLGTGCLVRSQGASLFADLPEVAESLAELYQLPDPSDSNELMVRSFKITRLLKATPLPDRLLSSLNAWCREVGIHESSPLDLRSAEDSPFDNPLRVRGQTALMSAIHKIYSEHFANALVRGYDQPSYDPFQDLPQLLVQVRIPCQRSGLVLTYEPKSKHQKVVSVLSAWGIAEDILRRQVSRDEIWFHKHSLALNLDLPISSYSGDQEFLLQYDDENDRLLHLDLSREKGRSFSILPHEAHLLAKQVETLEIRLGFLLELAWSASGEQLTLLGVRRLPEPREKMLKFFQKLGPGQVLLEGQATSHSLAVGRVRLVKGSSDLQAFQQGEVLVAHKTEPDWEPTFRKAAALITENDRRVSHSTILAREMGIPALLDVQGALDTLQDGQLVTVSCCEGTRGQVYSGEVEHQVETYSIARMPNLKTQLMVNLALPERAMDLAQQPWSGAGLVRSEFILGGWVKAHPLALLRPAELDVGSRSALARLTRGHASGADYFLQRCSQGIGVIASAFWPRPVTVRLSDLKSDEYARLIGGAIFEPKEQHSSLGWRGASRYLDPDYHDAFQLEMESIFRVREEMGFTNVKVMLPFCRTPEEAEELVWLIRELASAHQHPLEVWGMAELPSNVLLAPQFAQIFDGLSIGSSDLTSLVLGIDRSSERLAHAFDETHPALIRAYETIIEAAHNAGKQVSFCGQAASEDPEFAALLVEIGVDILSLAPDALHPTLNRLSRIPPKSS